MIPIVLFVYNRPEHLRKTLECFRENRVPLIYAFSDGPAAPDTTSDVAKVRDMLRAVNWCEVVLCERETNLGPGCSILTGVTAVLAKHEAAIIVEDDLIFVPGTYAYLCAALDQYQAVDRVMSVTGWTHPLVTPGDVTDLPYFDGRAECWVWGTWSRAWQGMDIDATTLIEQCKDKSIDIYGYGADLVDMAKAELRQNIWAVRFLYLHILKKGLCLRPPWSMVEHIGFDANATNARNESWLKNPPLKRCPPVPRPWPEPVENHACRGLWQKICGTRPTVLGHLFRFTRSTASKVIHAVFPK